MLRRSFASSSILATLFVAISFGEPTRGDDDAVWPIYRGNPQRTGCSPFKGPTQFREKWKTALGYEVGAAPVVDAKGDLYLAAGTSVTALDRDGRVLWQHDFVKSKHAHPYGAGRGAFPSASPGLNGDGLLVQPVGAIYLLSHVLGLHTQSSSETRSLWAHSMNATSRCSPLLIDDVSYTTIDGGVIALSAAGKLLWQARGPYYLNSSPAQSHDGKAIYVGGSDGSLYALDRGSGKKLWNSRRTDNARVRLPERDPSGAIIRQFTTAGHVPECPAVGTDGTVYFGSWDGFLRSVEPNGTYRWSIDLKDRLTSAPAITADGQVLISSFEGTLFKIVVVQGSPRVDWQVDANARYSSPLVTADGQVLVGTLDGRLCAYSLANGSLIHEIKLLNDWGAIAATPVPGGAGVVYVGGQDGILRAIE